MEMAIGKAAICVILNSTAWAQQFPVHHEHLRKFCAGTLTVDEHGIRFSGPKGHAWSWPYGEIQQLTLRAGSIHILSYKDLRVPSSSPSVSRRFGDLHGPGIALPCAQRVAQQFLNF